MKMPLFPAALRLALLLLITLGAATYSNAQIITTVAGTGTAGYSGDGGAATAAQIHKPFGVITDRSGNLYISDDNNQRIRKVNPSGIITTIAGTGTTGYSGDGGAATAARLNSPTGIAFDAAGNLYIAEYTNCVIRKVTLSGIISTVAGTGTTGYSGDGGPATAAKLNLPVGLMFDRAGNMYIGDQGNNRVRKITPAGIISTIAGTGTGTSTGDGGPATAATVYEPRYLAEDRAGNIYCSEYIGNRIRKIDTFGIITTFAGTGTSGFSGDGGPATAARLSYPEGIKMDSTGNMYIADADNNCIRKIAPSGIITTVAGVAGSAGYSGDGGPATAALLREPIDINFDTTGSMYIADFLNHAIRKITCFLLPYAGTITGAGSVCAGATASFSSSVSAGIWSSSSASIATVSSAGIVTGVTNGTVIISYSVTNSCGTGSDTALITVNPAPHASPITGASTFCIGANQLFADSVSGGVWSSNDTSVARISSAGMATGVGVGAATIFYAVTNSCGTAYAMFPVTISPLPDAGAIVSDSVVCVGSNITLTDTATGGLWSALNAHATVTAGVVTGVTVGKDTIRYVKSNSCGADTAFVVIRVIDTGICREGVSIMPYKGNTALDIFPNPTSGSITIYLSSSVMDNMTVTITNTLGKKVAGFDLRTNKPTDVDLKLPPGIYFVSAIINGERINAKIVVE